MWSRPANSLGWLLGSLLSTAVARAETPNERTAELLFREGRRLLSERDYSPACEKLEQSHKLDPAAGTLILLAFCHEKMGRFASAHREYTQAEDLANRSGDSDKSSAARRFAEKVRGKQHVLVVVLAKDARDVELRVDDETLPPRRKQAEIALDPGAHTLVASSRGERWEQGVRIPTVPGRTIVNVPSFESRPAATRGTTERSWWSENALGLGAVGVGVVGVGVGTFFGLRAFSKNDESERFCEPDQRCQPEGRELRDEARSAATISNVGFTVGIIGIATGTVMLLSSGSSTSSKRAAAGILGGRF